MRKMILAMTLFFLAPPVFAADVYTQSFDSLTDGATVNSVDSWTVTTGSAENALVSSADTASGSGKALNMIGASTTVKVERPASYGNSNPTWIEYVAKAGLGNDNREIPTTGIAAVNFSSSGKIQVSDDDAWIDSGKTYVTDTWYRVQMKLDFSTHTYDVYISPASVAKTPFVPDKEDLEFIDDTVDSLARIGFAGTYQSHSTQNTLVDEVVVHSVSQLQIITAPQTLVKSAASGPLTVELQNSGGEAQTAWKDIELELRSTTAGEFSLDKDDWSAVTSVVLPEDSQRVTFYYKDPAEGAPSITVNEYPDSGWTDALQDEKVVAYGDNFGVEATTPQVAGRPFDVRITAKNSSGEADTSYSGTVDLSVDYINPTSGASTLTPDTATGFANGVKDVQLTYPDAGLIKIVVRDRSESSKAGSSGDITVVPDSFSVTAATPQIISKTFPVTVKALSAEGQVTPNYSGTILLTPVPVTPTTAAGGAMNPSEILPAVFQAGVATFDTSYNRWGTIKIQAADPTLEERKGESAAVVFAPKSASIEVKRPSESRAFFYVGEYMEVSVSLLGEDDKPVENFQGTVSISSTPQLDIVASYTFADTDKGKKTFNVPATAPGFYKIAIQDTTHNLKAEVDKVEVKDATITVTSSSAPVGTTLVEIILTDSEGKRITSENEMTITIIHSEEVINGSVFFPNAGKSITFKRGVAHVIIGNSEAETVTISAKSGFGVKVVGGKVTFGRAGGGGIGALMLRETKD